MRSKHKKFEQHKKTYQFKPPANEINIRKYNGKRLD